MKVTIEVSGHHCHISSRDRAILFGAQYHLRRRKSISQPGQYAARETVTVKTPAGTLQKVRIVGPERNATHIEISQTEAYKLGVTAPLVGYATTATGRRGAVAEISGPRGRIKRPALIIAHRHIHCDLKTARKYKFKNGQKVSVRVSGQRQTTFHNVRIRINKAYVFRMHIDTDEANAAGIHGGGQGEIITK